MMVFLWRRRGFLMVSCGVLCGVFARGVEAQTTSKPKPSTSSSSKAGMAVWSPDVQQTLGVSQENFNAEGLNKLTKMQLVALLSSARIDPKKGLLTCPAGGAMPAGRIHVFVTVDGDDASMAALAGQVRQAVRGVEWSGHGADGGAGGQGFACGDSDADDGARGDRVYGLVCDGYSMCAGEGREEDRRGVEGNAGGVVCKLEGGWAGAEYCYDA